MDHRDNGLEQVPDGHPVADAAAGEGVGPGVEVLLRDEDAGAGVGGLVGGDVVARAEGASGAADEDDGHVVVAFGNLEGVDELAAEVAVEGVQLLGTVERDGRDAVAGGVEDVLVLGHGLASSDGGIVGGQGVVRGETTKGGAGTAGSWAVTPSS